MSENDGSSRMDNVWEKINGTIIRAQNIFSSGRMIQLDCRGTTDRRYHHSQCHSLFISCLTAAAK